MFNLYAADIVVLIGLLALPTVGAAICLRIRRQLGAHRPVG
jgi:hypothetical protein